MREGLPPFETNLAFGVSPELAGVYEDRKLFEVFSEEVYALVPSLPEGMAQINATEGDKNARASDHVEDEAEPELASASGGENDSEPDDDTTDGKKDPPIAFNRKALREGLGKSADAARWALMSGARLIASYDDPEAGAAAAKQTVGGVANGLLGNAEDYFLLAANSVRGLNRMTNIIGEEITTAMSSVGGRFTLLKALASGGDRMERGFAARRYGQVDWSAGRELATFSILADSGLQPALTAEFSSGAFDELIARDLVEFVARRDVTGTSFAKLHQTIAYFAKFNGVESEGESAFYDKLAATHTDWPTEHQERLLGAKHLILTGLESNFSRSHRWLKENGLMQTGDSVEQFEHALEVLALEVLRHLSSVSQRGNATLVPIKHELKRKHRKNAKQAAGQLAVANLAELAPAEVDAPPSPPMRMLTCNVKDGTATDGIHAIVEDFLSRTGQGGDTLREDIEHMMTFMARTDFPPGYRRGVRPLREVSLHLAWSDPANPSAEIPAEAGDENARAPEKKEYPVHKFKPSEAAGLPLRTVAAKDSRVYFIKPAKDVLAILALDHRSNQEAFIKKIRGIRQAVDPKA